MKPINIGFVGPYSDSNLGDYGMLVNNILDLKQHIVAPRIFTYDRDFISELVDSYFSDLVPVLCEVELEDHLRSIARNGDRLTPIEILQGAANYEEVEKNVIDLDVLVVNGGGYFNELWCQPHRIEKMLQILVPIVMAEDFGIPIIFTGNSYGPFGAKSAFLKDILATLRNASFYSRDRVGSIPELRQIGISEEKITFVPDDLFLLNESLAAPVEGLNLPESYVVFETYQPLDQLREQRDQFEKFNSAMKERGLSVVQLPLYEGRGGGDQSAWLAEEFGWLETPQPAGYLPLEQARQIVSGAEFVLCERYHALVLALASKTPALHSLRSVMGDKWYYYRKNLGILDTAFGNMKFRQRDFMALSPFESMERVSANFEEMKQAQSLLFEQAVDKNLELCEQSRRQMLDSIIQAGA